VEKHNFSYVSSKNFTIPPTIFHPPFATRNPSYYLLSKEKKSVLKKIPKQVIILGFVSLFTDMASEMLYPVTPIFLTAVLGSSMAVVGLIEGIAELTAGILKGYAGSLSDKLKKRSIFVVIGYSISALSKPLPGIFPSIGIVGASRATDRVGKGIRTAPRDALLASYSEKNMGAVFGFHRGMDTLGAAIGPLLALLFLNLYHDNYQLIFLIAFIPSIIAVSFTLSVKDNIIIKEKKNSKNLLLFFKESSKTFKQIILLLTLFAFVNSSDVFLILKSRAVTSSSSLAIIGYVFYNLVYAFASYPVGKISDKLGKKKILITGFIIYSLVYLGFALVNNLPIIFLLFAFYGIYAASTEGIAKAWVSDLIPDENRGKAIGILTMTTSIAIMLGSFLAGVLWDTFGSAVPFLFSSIISLSVAIIFIFTKE
jgi:MFS family permease